MKNKKIDIGVELINKMFEVAGHSVTFDDIKERTDNWYTQWTMTEEQNKEWREWGIDYLRKKKRWNKILAGREMAMFDLCYGLKIEQNETTI